MWPFKRKKTTEAVAVAVGSKPVDWDGVHTVAEAISTEAKKEQKKPYEFVEFLKPAGVPVAAMDSELSTGIKGDANKLNMFGYGIPEPVYNWFVGQGFIGYHVAALVSQHWLVEKGMAVKSRDAVRHGWEYNITDELEAGEAADEFREKTQAMLFEKDMKTDIKARLVQHLLNGFTYGVSYALTVVESTDPEYYELPFNSDVSDGENYKGFKIIDPTFVYPELIGDNINDPTSDAFYRPEFYRIGNKRYHHSHLIKFVPHPVPDVLKPTYNYGGVSVPQRLYERVYAADRSANEAPALLMSKRLNILKVSQQAMENMGNLLSRLKSWMMFRDNFGAQLVSNDEEVNQIDTALADVDSVIMTQYQLVAAIIGVPATKLLETTPKGFNSTGEYEEGSYRESLESIQEHDCTPILKRHYEMTTKGQGIACTVSPVWNPSDTPTAVEAADIELKKSQTYSNLRATNAVTDEDIRAALGADENSAFFGVKPYTEQELEEIDEQPVGSFGQAGYAPLGGSNGEA